MADERVLFYKQPRLKSAEIEASLNSCIELYGHGITFDETEMNNKGRAAGNWCQISLLQPVAFKK